MWHSVRSIIIGTLDKDEEKRLIPPNVFSYLKTFKQKGSMLLFSQGEVLTTGEAIILTTFFRRNITC
jgi:hypothetical protein